MKIDIEQALELYNREGKECFDEMKVSKIMKIHSMANCIFDLMDLSLKIGWAVGYKAGKRGKK